MWKDCNKEIPNNDRIVLAKGKNGGVYTAKYRDGYYWYRPQQKSGEIEPVAWMDIPE